MLNSMVLDNSSKLRLPSCYVEVTDEEMEYLDGGMGFWAKAGIISACVVIGAAIETGTIWILAGASKGAFAAAAAKFGAMTVATFVVSCIGGGAGGGIAIVAILCS